MDERGVTFTVHASGSKGNLYTLTDGTTTLLIDPGLPIAKIRRALNFGLSKIDFALLSHSHADHSKGASGVLRAGIDLYTGEATIKELGIEGQAMAIKEREQVTLGSWRVLSLPVPHDVPNLAYLMQSGENKCLYLIDAEYCPYQFRGLTHVFLGVNYDKDILISNIERGHLDPSLGRRIMQNHMSLQTALAFFKAQDIRKVQEIHLLHASAQNMDLTKAKDSLQRATGKLVVVH